MQSCVAVTSLTAGLQHALKYEFLPAQDPAMHLARRSPRLGFGGIARSRKGGSGGRAPPRGGILRGGGVCPVCLSSAQLSSALHRGRCWRASRLQRGMGDAPASRVRSRGVGVPHPLDTEQEAAG